MRLYHGLPPRPRRSSGGRHKGEGGSTHVGELGELDWYKQLLGKDFKDEQHPRAPYGDEKRCAPNIRGKL